MNETFTLETLKSKTALQEDLKQQWTHKQEEFRNANLELYNKLLAINVDIAQYEEGMKDYMLNTFKEDGNKKFDIGQIKIFKEYTYDPQEALNWAIDKKMCLQLDIKHFEQLIEPLGLEFTTIKEIPKATITRKC